MTEIKKSVGLDYKQTLVEINNALEFGVKADHNISYRGKVMINLEVDASGNIASIAFDQEIPTKLEATIKETLEEANVTPVQLNGKAKSQSFKIPVIIK